MRHNEEHLQESCVRWFDLQYSQYRLLLHHSPNGGRRNVREAARFKKMGVRAGFPDLLLLLPCESFHYLAIEMKTDGGIQTESQREMQRMIEATGGCYQLVRDFDTFRIVVNRWMNNFLQHI